MVTIVVLVSVLVVLGIALTIVGVRLVRATRTDPAALGPLEVMGERQWRRAGPAERSVVLASARANPQPQEAQAGDDVVGGEVVDEEAAVSAAPWSPPASDDEPVDLAPPVAAGPAEPSTAPEPLPTAPEPSPTAPEPSPTAPEPPPTPQPPEPPVPPEPGPPIPAPEPQPLPPEPLPPVPGPPPEPVPEPIPQPPVPEPTPSPFPPQPNPAPPIPQLESSTDEPVEEDDESSEQTERAQLS